MADSFAAQKDAGGKDGAVNRADDDAIVLQTAGRSERANLGAASAVVGNPAGPLTDKEIVLDIKTGPISLQTNGVKSLRYLAKRHFLDNELAEDQPDVAFIRELSSQLSLFPQAMDLSFRAAGRVAMDTAIEHLAHPTGPEKLVEMFRPAFCIAAMRHAGGMPSRTWTPQQHQDAADIKLSVIQRMCIRAFQIGQAPFFALLPWLGHPVLSTCTWRMGMGHDAARTLEHLVQSLEYSNEMIELWNTRHAVLQRRRLFDIDSIMELIFLYFDMASAPLELVRAQEPNTMEAHYACFSSPAVMMRLPSLIWHGRLGAPLFFTRERQTIYLDHLKTLPCNVIAEQIAHHSPGFQIRNQQVHVVGIEVTWETSEFSRPPIGEPTAEVASHWAANQAHHVDFVCIALRHRSIVLLKYLLDRVLNHVVKTPALQIELELALKFGSADFVDVLAEYVPMLSMNKQ
jgi:hypothetical protein